MGRNLGWRDGVGRPGAAPAPTLEIIERPAPCGPTGCECRGKGLARVAPQVPTGGPCACRGVGFSFIFSWLLMLVVLLTFLLGGNTYMLVCESWRSQQLFQVGCPRPATSAAPFGMLSPAVPPCTVPTVPVSSALSSWIPPDSYLASTCRRRWATRAAP